MVVTSFNPDDGLAELNDAGMITGIVLCLLCGLTIVGTFFMIFIFCKNKSLHSNQNILILYLSCASFCLCVNRLVFTGSAVSKRAYQWGKLGCEIDGFNTMYFCHICICTYAAMGVERYLTIVRSMTLKTWHFFTILALNSLWALFSTTSTYWTDRTHQYHVLQPSNTYCTLDWWTSIYFTHISALGTVVLSLLIFAAGYYGLVRHLRHHAREWRDTADLWVSEETFNDPNETIRWKKPRYCQLVAEKSVVLVLTFLANWLMYAYVMIYGLVTDTPTASIIDCIAVVLVFNNNLAIVIYTVLLDKRWRGAAWNTLGLHKAVDLEKNVSIGPKKRPISKAASLDEDPDITASDLGAEHSAAPDTKAGHEAHTCS
ncbi:hypothetical protein HDU89_000278 [Geranomyces variabilis]|nr:hypothetical protein HDU89_000278 [Geranomyces variabilis]